jgi:hexokinase
MRQHLANFFYCSSRLKTHLDTQANYIAADAIKIVSISIAKRAARLSGVAIAAIVLRSGLLSDLPATLDAERTCGQDVLLTKSDHTSNGRIKFYLRKTFLTAWSFIRDYFDSSMLCLQSTPLVDIGVTGSLWERYPGFEQMAREVLRSVDGIGEEGEKRIRIVVTKNGSLVGAALAAALANDIRVQKTLDDKGDQEPLITF